MGLAREACARICSVAIKAAISEGSAGMVLGPYAADAHGSGVGLTGTLILKTGKEAKRPAHLEGSMGATPEMSPGTLAAARGGGRAGRALIAGVDAESLRTRARPAVGNSSRLRACFLEMCSLARSRSVTAAPGRVARGPG